MCGTVRLEEQNKFLFKRLLNEPEKPDGFLVVVRAQQLAADNRQD
jgi:hypothetical protein